MKIKCLISDEKYSLEANKIYDAQWFSEEFKVVSADVNAFDSVFLEHNEYEIVEN